MDELEQIEGELRRSLQHIAPPDGFTGRVMDRIASRASTQMPLAASRKSAGGFFLGGYVRPDWWIGVAAAAILAVGGGDLLHVRHERQIQQAAAAQAQVDLAMQLTSHALNEVEVGLDRSPAGRFTQLLNETPK